MKVYILLIFLLIYKVDNLQCGDEYIEHCLECNNETDIDSCKTCEDNYFPFLENALCIPCDDNVYGQVGCSGKCSDTNLDYSHKGNFKCDGICKEGYYNLNNICKPCSYGLSNCGKCTYETNSNNFNCIECKNNQFKLKDGKCNECDIQNCYKCHYDGDLAICDKCNQGYYIKDKKCSGCYWHEISEGKICQICSDDLTNYEDNSCYCMTHYIEGDSK